MRNVPVMNTLEWKHRCFSNFSSLVVMKSIPNARLSQRNLSFSANCLHAFPAKPIDFDKCSVFFFFSFFSLELHRAVIQLCGWAFARFFFLLYFIACGKERCRYSLVNLIFDADERQHKRNA